MISSSQAGPSDSWHVCLLPCAHPDTHTLASQDVFATASKRDHSDKELVVLATLQVGNHMLSHGEMSSHYLENKDVKEIDR